MGTTDDEARATRKSHLRPGNEVSRSDYDSPGRQPGPGTEKPRRAQFPPGRGVSYVHPVLLILLPLVPVGTSVHDQPLHFTQGVTRAHEVDSIRLTRRGTCDRSRRPGSRRGDRAQSILAKRARRKHALALGHAAPPPVGKGTLAVRWPAYGIESAAVGFGGGLVRSARAG